MKPVYQGDRFFQAWSFLLLHELGFSFVVVALNIHSKRHFPLGDMQNVDWMSQNYFLKSFFAAIL